MVMVADQLRDRYQGKAEDPSTGGDQNGGRISADPSSVTIADVPDAGSPSPADRACVRAQPVQGRDGEDVSRTSSTQYSDVTDDGFDDDIGAPVMVSDVPTVGDVCIKDSPNVHFGQKTFYNGPVTVEKIVYPNPSSTEGKHDGDGNRSDAKTDGGTVDPEKAQDHHKVSVKEWCALMLTWRCVALTCVMGSCIVTAAVVGAVFLSNGGLRFVEREAWGAKPPTGAMNNLTLPVPYVIISHTATTFCETQSECSGIVRSVQSFHAESRRWSDIAYNFLVGGDGYVYVGRGWDTEGAHSYGYNKKSIGISFVGTFNDVSPPRRQLLAAQQLIDLGIEKGKVQSDYILLGHRQVSRTKSPGDILYDIIKTWSHWAPTPATTKV